MNTSNAAVQTSETKSQKGFSLIELLVVVAIIGVLAAAGIVGYQSYLDGVKKDTHTNNAISLVKGMEIASVAASTQSESAPAGCKSFNNTQNSTNALACAKDSLGTPADLAKFKSPYDSTLSGDTYIKDGAVCTAPSAGPPAVPGTEKQILVTNPSGTKTIEVRACDHLGALIGAARSVTFR